MFQGKSIAYLLGQEGHVTTGGSLRCFVRRADENKDEIVDVGLGGASDQKIIGGLQIGIGIVSA